MNQRILFILTSHDRKGDAPSGYYLSEVSHPYYILRDAGYQIDFASPKGGKTHVDGLDLSDPDNAAFWNDAALRAQTENTPSPPASTTTAALSPPSATARRDCSTSAWQTVAT